MPIATPEVYADMISRAKAGGFAYPAINCTSSETVNAALRGFADAGSDGIIQISTGGAEFASGTRVEEDGVANEINEKLYTAPGDFVQTAKRLGLGEKGVYLLAATFGNVHGVYKPGNVKLRPEILKQGQEVVAEELGLGKGAKPFNLVFHGGSGSDLDDIREAIGYGVVKMNVDTDTQYAFTRPIAGPMFSNYDGVLKVDGEVGNKKAYDPRSYNKLAETGMAERIVTACEDLLSAGQSTAG